MVDLPLLSISAKFYFFKHWTEQKKMKNATEKALRRPAAGYFELKKGSWFSNLPQRRAIRRLVSALYRKNICYNTKLVHSSLSKFCTRINQGMLTNGLSSFKNFLKVTLAKLVQ